ncbi:ABC transporter permease [Erythrobacter sp. HL-111]|uniref:cell division protein FtsX n=1 Tax=Erythrobacter sp. HL-111 TaxID=1798193 RepID=UPI0006D9EC8C|nr:cell division protein [Erythrobacter sp. HL-111]KPP87389.1 MAG: cell division transport system permease protein FtsX [Erythrobacteraceae bacterium HL-111]SDS96810.1 cell division transport system permease protein [Erythrobacter sp. HL-111]
MTTPPLAEKPSRRAAPVGARLAASLIPSSRFGGAMPWVIALLTALVVIAAAGGLALGNLAANARADLSGAVTVQVIEADPAAREAGAERAARILTAEPLVRSVRVVPRAELVDLLEPWLGSGAQSGEVPIPALIDVELVREADAAEIAALTAALEGEVPGARVDAQSDWLRPVYDALAALQWLALALIALVAFATAAAVWLAARSAFANHRDTVEIVHLLGGTDRQVTRIFQRAMIRDAAFGALLGALLGTVAVFVLGRQFAGLDSGMVAGGALGIGDWGAIAAIPVLAVALAALTGRITIAFALRKML